jgi:cell division protein FtsQ
MTSQMDRTFAAQRPRLVVPRAADLTRVVRWMLRRPRLRRRLVLACGVLALPAGGWVAVRDSPLVSVDQVQIRGVHGVEAANVQAALIAAAQRETTLHVQMGPLLAAVAPFRVVRDLRVSTSFPHGMRITVVERLPVATLVATGGLRMAVAADGTLLGSQLAAAPTPQLAVAALPTGRVADPHTLDQLAVLGAAPAPLARRMSRVWTGASGITVAMRNGPTILFGDATRPHAKWASASRVLADPSSSGATYIDVRIPDRPAAGGLALQAAGAGGQVTATDPTAAALAASLEAAVNGSSAGAAAATPGTATATGAGTTASGTAATTLGAGSATSAPATGAGPISAPPTGTATPAGGSAGGTTGAAPGASGAAALAPQTASGQQSTSTGG